MSRAWKSVYNSPTAFFTMTFFKCNVQHVVVNPVYDSNSILVFRFFVFLLLYFFLKYFVALSFDSFWYAKLVSSSYEGYQLFISELHAHCARANGNQWSVWRLANNNMIFPYDSHTFPKSTILRIREFQGVGQTFKSDILVIGVRKVWWEAPQVQKRLLEMLKMT